MSNSSFKYAKSLEKTDFKIGIAKSKWNDRYVEMLVDSSILHLKQNNIKKIHLIGHSAGVATLNAWYASYTSQILSRTCIDPVHHIWICRNAQKPLVNDPFHSFKESIKNFTDLTNRIKSTFLNKIRVCKCHIH